MAVIAAHDSPSAIVDRRTHNDVAHVCKIVMGWYLMLLSAPWLFMQAMMKGLESERASLPARTIQGRDRADLIDAAASQRSMTRSG
jgi:hypothetical protein